MMPLLAAEKQNADADTWLKRRERYTPNSVFATGDNTYVGRVLNRGNISQGK